MITDAQKKYLKIIFQLGGDIELVSNKMLSKKLGAAPPSISQMLDRLTEAGFVKSEHYRGVMLTKKGSTYTIEMTNNHEIIKAFFIKVLNINSSEVNQEVDLIENHVSDKFVQRLSEYLRTKQF